MNPGGAGFSEPRSCHCTPAWATEQDSTPSQNNINNNTIALLLLVIDYYQLTSTEHLLCTTSVLRALWELILNRFDNAKDRKETIGFGNTEVK